MMITNNHSLPTLLAGMLTDPSVLADIIVTGISSDSRDVQEGNVFLSLAKNNEHRENNLEQALTSDIAVVLFDSQQGLTEQENELLRYAKVIVCPVKELSDKVGEIAARFYGHPSLALTVIAITGTNGKTSVSQFIAQALESLGYACGVIGTLGVGRIDNLNNTGMTTPDPISVQKTLADFCEQGIKYAVVESSSHALAQGRLNSVTVDVAVLTNLSRDHLDYHGNMENYSAAKKQLFDFESIKTAVINSADDFGKRLISELEDRKNVNVLTYSSSETSQAKFQAENIEMIRTGINFDVRSSFGLTQLKSTLLGQFNVDNLLAALASLTVTEIDFERLLSAINQCHAVDGRMQTYDSEHYALIVVDFAHTPDALTQALTSIREHISGGDVWCVFGCGGDRDTGKRRLMGLAVEKCADQVVITDDNPRNEDASQIVKEIMSGLSNPEHVVVEHDRKLAITHAITHAKESDIVLIAGKGHEDCQEIKGVKTPFNDGEMVLELLHAANDATLTRIGESA